MKKFLNTRTIRAGVETYQFDLHAMLNDLATNIEPDMDTYSCSMAVDTMEAYYKVRVAPLDTLLRCSHAD